MDSVPKKRKRSRQGASYKVDYGWVASILHSSSNIGLYFGALHKDASFSHFDTRGSGASRLAFWPSKTRHSLKAILAGLAIEGWLGIRGEHGWTSCAIISTSKAAWREIHSHVLFPQDTNPSATDAETQAAAHQSRPLVFRPIGHDVTCDHQTDNVRHSWIVPIPRTLLPPKTGEDSWS